MFMKPHFARRETKENCVHCFSTVLQILERRILHKFPVAAERNSRWKLGKLLSLL